ncbi:hypothetical protein PTSG_03529 [Salpingoeca rosetta]|uniref:Uncharacterized protein n=1 Tax=Salpingoeca rosetta (strain ATCC 50818 / BSB-021) TaxID=946362 RepID=F2U5V7_SALR5|nr:uncharacterized protein PTSG_03529 [Salpingoeca rosetta]EGD82898.1 hypothetical protein PTSG_03529 [Salpingoeca rosetta]|eukprot:XP_004995262.1 hypothetical protein PTSG_03529 [Salpingoeca rosetta]
MTAMTARCCVWWAAVWLAASHLVVLDGRVAARDPDDVASSLIDDAESLPVVQEQKDDFQPFDVEELFDEITKDDVGAVQRAIDLGFDPEGHADRSGELAFHHAASVGALNVCKFFVNVLLMDVNTRHSDGSTPAIVAAWHGHKDVLDYLIEKGADAHAKCYNGWNAVMGAVYWNEYDMLLYLASLGIALDEPEKDGEWTPLKVAAARGHAHMVDFLLRHGADPLFIDSRGRTPKMLAESKGFHLIAERLAVAERERRKHLELEGMETAHTRTHAHDMHDEL